MTEKEFRTLPKSVQSVLTTMGIDMKYIKHVKDNANGTGILIIDTDTDTVSDKVMNDDIATSRNDNSNDCTATAMAARMEEFTKQNPALAHCVKQLIKSGVTNTDMLVDLTGIDKDLAEFAIRPQPAQNEYIVPVTGLIRVIAPNADMAIECVQQAIENEEVIQLSVNGIGDIEDVCATTSAYQDGILNDSDIDASFVMKESCPYAAACAKKQHKE